ncbi:MAG: ABC transporter C-terminal domain-containing protein [Nanoarchaeota archaeon]
MVVELTGQAVGGEIVNISTGIVSEVGRLGHWLEAIGVVVVLGIIFQLISILYSHNRKKKIEQIEKDIERIEKKIDKLIR